MMEPVTEFCLIVFYFLRHIEDCVCCICLKQIVIINIYIALSAF